MFYFLLLLISTHMRLLYICALARPCAQIVSLIIFQSLHLIYLFSLLQLFFIQRNVGDSSPTSANIGWPKKIARISDIGQHQLSMNSKRVLASALPVKTLQSLGMLNVSGALRVQGLVSSMVWCFRRGHEPKLVRRWEGTVDCKNKTKTRLGSNYSYYQILIVEDAQPITYVHKQEWVME